MSQTPISHARFKPLRFAASISMACLLTSAALAEDFTLDKLNIDLGLYKIGIPSAVVKGSSLSKAEFQSLIEGKNPEPLAKTLARLNATSITAAKLNISTVLAGVTSDYSDDNVVLNDITSGRIAKMVSSGGGGGFVDKLLGPSKVTWTGMAAEAIDMTGMAEIWTTTRAPGTPPSFRTLYGSYSIASMVQNLGSGITVTMGTSSGANMAMSAGTAPLSARFATLMEFVKDAEKVNTDKAEPKPETKPDPKGPGWGASPQAPKPSQPARAGADQKKPDAKTIDGMLSLWEDMRFGTLEGKDLVVTVKADKKLGLDEAGEFRIARMSFADTGDIAKSGFIMEGVKARFGQNSFDLGKIAMTGFSGQPTIAALRAEFAKGTPFDGKDFGADFDYKKLFPILGSIVIKDVQAKIPDPASKVKVGEFKLILNYGMRGMEMTSRAQENGIPTDVKLAIEGITAPLPNDASTKDLIAMGYKTIDVSNRIDFGWIKDKNEITLRDLSLDAVGMLNLSIKGIIGNASKELFSGDATLAQIAALGATVKTLDLKLDNLGLLDKFLENEAKKAKKEPEALRREWGSLAALALPAIIGDTDAAKAITGAISRFVARPKTLAITATSKGASGIGLADVIAGGDPKSVLGKIDVKASAE
jgi:hypothetical protein